MEFRKQDGRPALFLEVSNPEKGADAKRKKGENKNGEICG